MARKMKDSGIEWIGEIPEGWELRKGKSLYRVTTGKLDANAENPDGDYPFFTCSMTPKRINSYSFDCEALLVAGNGLVGFTQYYKGKFDAYQRTYVLSDFRNVLPSFLRYYVSVGLPMEVQPKSIGSVIQFIKLGDLLNFNITLPSIEQQTIISNYLEFKIIQIDAILSKTRSSIEEYKKLKQAVITQAVTKGVRGEREMKDSGVEWIGEIPKEWDILNLVAHTSMLTPMRDRPENLDGPIPWIRIEDFDGKYISSSKASLGVSKETVRSMNLKIYPVGTILCTSSCIMGKCAIVSRELVSNQRFIGIIPDQNTCENFLYYLMLSNSERMNYLATGALQANLSRSSFEHLKVQFPSYQEQKEISDYLDTKCAEIDKLIAKKEQLVKELESYKKSLIYEVVTGKREV